MPSVEFILFACVLAGVALFHRQAMRIAVAGAVVIAVYKVLWSPFKTGGGLPGLGLHLQHEWVILVNLLLLLLGFALLADLFEKSQVPAALPAYLPDDWKGAFLLLVLVFVMSSFLDNIAAAMIGECRCCVSAAGMPNTNRATPEPMKASSTWSGSTPAIHIIVVVVSPTTLPEPPPFEAATIAAR